MEENLTPHTIYLVRHGESIGNVERVFLSAEDDVLSPDGELQVELLAKHLSDVNFTRMFSSDFPRAIDTAGTILSESKDPEIILHADSRLRERSYGVFEDISYKDAFKQLQMANVPFMEFEIPEGESVADVVNRMGSFMQELCDDLDENEEPETVLVVSHSFAIAAFIHWLCQQSEDFQMINWDFEKDFKLLGNACYMKIEVDRKVGLEMSPRKINFLAVNESSHLESLGESSGGLSSFIAATEEAKDFIGCVQQ